jgi:heme o synthase
LKSLLAGALNFFLILLELGKVRITAVVAVSTTFGYMLAAKSLTIELLMTVIGVFLTAAGASALNQYQEREYDALMSRAAERPIPSGRISPLAALISALIICIAGIAVLYFFAGIVPAILGIIAFVWYNFVYTLLKRVSSIAVIPGSLIGSIPPAIGWVAGGGSLNQPEIIFICIFFFIWQIPHFWLLLLVYDDEYKKAGFPVLTQVLSQPQLLRVTFSWIIGQVAVSLTFPLFSPDTHIIALIAITLAGGRLIYLSSKILGDSLDRKLLRKTFMELNFFVLIFLTTLTIDKFI